METRDFKRELKHLYLPPKDRVVSVDVPAMNFLMVTGQGDPNTSQSYTDAVEALFSASYTIKFSAKKGALAVDYGVMPLEGLWWADDMSDFVTGDRAGWLWTMMIMQPPFVDAAMVDEALTRVRDKMGASLPELRFESFSEGLCAQTMHIGPFSAEGPTIERVHDFIENSGRRLSGKHHEIYLTDIRRAAPDRWKTVIRQPME